MNLVIEDGTNIYKNGMSERFKGGRAKERPIAGGGGKWGMTCGQQLKHNLIWIVQLSRECACDDEPLFSKIISFFLF